MPSGRGKDYANEMLSLALEITKEMEMKGI
jgi:predicted acetyltransferase